MPETELPVPADRICCCGSRGRPSTWRPLASVNETPCRPSTGVSEMVYRHKFSAVPMDSNSATGWGTALAQRIRVDSNSAAAFGNALTDERNIKRIDIFGSYPNHSPLAYESVVEPAARQWLAASPAERSAF